MATSSHHGLFERYIVKSPLSPIYTCFALYFAMILIFGSTAFLVGELHLFISDFPALSIVFAAIILLYGDVVQGIHVKEATEEFAQVFRAPTQISQRFLNSYFNLRDRVVGGVIGGVTLFFVYETFGFWYQSEILLTLGRVFTVVLGFLVGELIPAAFHLTFGSRLLIREVADAIDILDYKKLKGIEKIGSLSIEASLIGGMAGFVALFGQIVAPWRLGFLANEVILVVLVGLFLLVGITFTVPLGSIHRVTEDAITKIQSHISLMTIDTYALFEKAMIDGWSESNPLNEYVARIDTIQLLDTKVKAYPRRPFNLSQLVSVLGSFILVIIESILVIFLNSLIS